MIKTYQAVRRHLPLDEIAELTISFLMPLSISAGSIASSGAFELISLLDGYEGFKELYIYYRRLSCIYEADSVERICIQKFGQGLAEDYQSMLQDILQSCIYNEHLEGVKSSILDGAVVSPDILKYAQERVPSHSWSIHPLNDICRYLQMRVASAGKK